MRRVWAYGGVDKTRHGRAPPVDAVKSGDKRRRIGWEKPRYLALFYKKGLEGRLGLSYNNTNLVI